MPQSGASWTQSIVMERIYAIPKPGTDRLVSGSTTAASVSFVGPNNQVRLSRAIRTMDDGFAFGGPSVGTVQSQTGAQSLIVAGIGYETVLGQGNSDTVPNGTSVDFQRLSDGVILGSAVIVSQSEGPGLQPREVTFNFDRSLPGNLVGTVMYSTDANQNGAGSILERSTVQKQSTCCNGINISGLAGSAVRGNYLRQTAFSGVFMPQSMTPGQPPGAPLANLTISKNVIDGTIETPDWWWFQFGSIQTVTLTSTFDLMTHSVFSNIYVTNNFMADSRPLGRLVGEHGGRKRERQLYPASEHPT